MLQDVKYNILCVKQSQQDAGVKMIRKDRAKNTIPLQI
jgi:hypothetical protein